MPMPILTEEGLAAIRAILVRDLNVENPHEAMEDRFDDLEDENPVAWEWLKNTAESMERVAIRIPGEYEIPEGVPVDDERTFISLRLAQNMLLTTVIQLYKAIKVKMEVEEMEQM